MLRKLFIINIVIAFFATTLVAGQTDDLFTKKKIQIDDRFRGLGLDPSLYHIWIGTRADANLDSKYRIQDKKSKKQKEYIPGLPTIPTSPKKEKTSQSTSWNEGYVVYLYIDPSYDTPELKNTMQFIIKTDIWPALNHCDDCIQFEVKELYKITDNKSESGASEAELKILEEKLKELQEAKEIQAENEVLSTRFEELELKLQEITDANIALERTVELAKYELEEKEKELIEQEQIDSEENIQIKAEEIEQLKTKIERAQDLEMQYYKEQYALQNMFRDSLLKSYGQKVDQIHNPIEGCMNPNARNFNPRANKDCLNCCSYDQESPLYIEGCTDVEALNYNLKATEDDGTCEYPIVEEETGGNILLWVLIGLIILLIILAIFAIIGNRKKVVYLKPKEKEISDKDADESESKETTKPATTVAAQQPVMPPTTAPMDEGVLQSEVQRQRQSAVAMSAGQKEGATQILKDWLDESKSEENTEE
tara:strand:+ start:50 stop:1489 length:1440 start_codon:yes stop_codon:yes gene_type:complete